MALTTTAAMTNPAPIISFLRIDRLRNCIQNLHVRVAEESVILHAMRSAANGFPSHHSDTILLRHARS
jgi:hypothetical protein